MQLQKTSYPDKQFMYYKQNSKTNENETKENYKTVIKGFITHFFPRKALQPQKRYFWQGMFKAWELRYNNSYIA